MILITTSGTSSTLCQVCLVVLSRTRRDGEKMRMGGLVENKLKKLKGLRLTRPSASMVLAKQIGRGATEVCRKCCLSTGDSIARSTIMTAGFFSKPEEKDRYPL